LQKRGMQICALSSSGEPHPLTRDPLIPYSATYAHPAVPPKLRAAAMLLANAGRPTLIGLNLYLGNAIAHPHKRGFRTIQLTNPLFQERIWTVPGGESYL